jgi:thymidylate kinase
MEQRVALLQREIENRRGGKRPFLVAIDGGSASGKSTLGAALAEALGAALIHMDDFFLPIPLRTPERFARPGGNVHYERFREEVLPKLRQASAFSYRRFDCSVMDFRGERSVGTLPFRIVEGSYSTHPELGRYADIAVFSRVEPNEQMARILRRNGPEKAERFRREWIPLEETYFSAYEIQQKSDICC